MKAQVQSGMILDLIAPTGGVVKDEGYIFGEGLFIIAVVTAAQTEVFAGVTEGVYEMAKEPTAAFDVGDVAYWDDTAKEFDESASGRYGCATVVEAAAASSTTVKVKLFGHSVAAVP